jgi:hypothetical protein
MKDLRELPSAMCYATSEFGCFNNQIFLEWFQTCFIPNCGSMRPVCLLLNNMCSLLTVPIIEAAVENDVVLVGIPSHAASILHPIEAKVVTYCYAQTFITTFITSHNCKVISLKKKMCVIMPFRGWL